MERIAAVLTEDPIAMATLRPLEAVFRLVGGWSGVISLYSTLVVAYLIYVYHSRNRLFILSLKTKLHLDAGI